jgi:hypothetical protein
MRFSSHCATFFVFTALICADVLGADPADKLRADVRDALRDSVRVSNGNREAIVHRLVEVFGEIMTADAVNDAERDRMHAQVRARLARLSTIIKRQMELDATAANAAGQAAPAKPLTANARPPDNQVLAQRFVPPAGAGMPGALPGGARQAAGFRRPPALGFDPNAAAAAGQPPDNGPALVDLIQRTISPASWDVNGGPGSIVYFRPSRALVVRQRSEVHEQLQGVVRALRQ